MCIYIRVEQILRSLIPGFPSVYRLNVSIFVSALAIQIHLQPNLLHANFRKISYDSELLLFSARKFVRSLCYWSLEMLGKREGEQGRDHMSSLYRCAQLAWCRRLAFAFIGCGLECVWVCVCQLAVHIQMHCNAISSRNVLWIVVVLAYLTCIFHVCSGPCSCELNVSIQFSKMIHKYSRIRWVVCVCASAVADARNGSHVYQLWQNLCTSRTRSVSTQCAGVGLAKGIKTKHKINSNLFAILVLEMEKVFSKREAMLHVPKFISYKTMKAGDNRYGSIGNWMCSVHCA